jgi:hypothetical protein
MSEAPTAKKIPATGSRAQVWAGLARHTSGGLTKESLMESKTGAIVSRKASANAKARAKAKGGGLVGGALKTSEPYAQEIEDDRKECTCSSASANNEHDKKPKRSETAKAKETKAKKPKAKPVKPETNKDHVERIVSMIESPTGGGLHVGHGVRKALMRAKLRTKIAKIKDEGRKFDSDHVTADTAP